MVLKRIHAAASAVVLAVAGLTGGPLWADEYPSRPVTIIVASTPGGGYYLQPALPFQISYAYINYNNPTYGAVFKQLYFRQALMMLDDQARMNAAVGRGYSASTVAGVPSVYST